MEMIGLVHSPAHVERVRRACDCGEPLDFDTPAGPAAWEAALLAVGCAAAAVDAGMTGEAERAFAAVRPPGHHAEPGRAMGFCYFSTAAVAARLAQARHGAARVAVLDFDVHHGNGTQAAFWDDPSVLFCSIHEDPRTQYPRTTGFATETGEGAGEGFNLNLPLPAGAGDAEFLAAHDAALARVCKFRPDLLVISAGFDAHAADPLGHLDVTTAGYAEATRRIVAAHLGPIVSLLEGGYDLAALGESAAAHVQALAGLAGEAEL